MKGVWKKITGRYATGEEYWIGKVRVGYCSNALVARGAPAAYDAKILLPYITIKNPRRSTPAEAKYVVEVAVNKWFEWVNEPTASIEAPKGD